MHGDVAGQAGRHIDEATTGRSRVGRDEETLASECGPLQRFHDTALGLRAQLDTGRHGHHRSGLDTSRFATGQLQPRDTVGRGMTCGDLHGVILTRPARGRGSDHFCESLEPTMACAAESRAIGTRNGEQLT